MNLGQPPTIVNLQQRAVELADLMSSFLSDVHAALARSDQHAEPTPDDWTALEIQMNALGELQRARDALARATAAPPVGSTALDILQTSPRMKAPSEPRRLQRLLMAA